MHLFLTQPLSVPFATSCFCHPNIARLTFSVIGLCGIRFVCLSVLVMKLLRDCGTNNYHNLVHWFFRAWQLLSFAPFSCPFHFFFLSTLFDFNLCTQNFGSYCSINQYSDVILWLLLTSLTPSHPTWDPTRAFTILYGTDVCGSVKWSLKEAFLIPYIPCVTSDPLL